MNITNFIVYINLIIFIILLFFIILFIIIETFNNNLFEIIFLFLLFPFLLSLFSIILTEIDKQLRKLINILIFVEFDFNNLPLNNKEH